MRFELPPFVLLLPALAACARPTPVAPRNGMSRVQALVARGDTAGALTVLDTLVRSDRQDASAWHMRGMLAWETLRTLRKQPGKQMPAKIAMQQMADSSLRLAVRLAPDSARFALDLGRYFMSTGLIQLRVQADNQFRRAVEVARRAGDGATEAEARDEIGMIYWRRYEGVSGRRIIHGTLDANELLGRPRAARDYLDQTTQAVDPSVGELDYRRSTAQFDSARAADPRNRRAVRHNFMSLAEPGHWVELRRAADAQLTARPGDADALFARGLAAHRLGDDHAAAAAFEAALAAVPAAERERLTTMTRLLRPSDSAKFAALSPAERAEAERMFWARLDPLTLTPENEHRLEFLSRVTHAELLWTSDDFGLHGSDSDRGVTYIRYGPPRTIAGFAPEVSRGYDADHPLGALQTVSVGLNSTVWYYEDLDLAFVFNGSPSYGTSRYAGAMAELAPERAERLPWSWGNVPVTLTLDTVGVQLARFRAPGDSVDLAIYAEVPVRRMTEGVDLVNGPVDVAMSVYDSLYRTLARDSSREVVAFAKAASARRAWRRRLPPMSAAHFRVEAWQGDAARAARASGVLSLDRRRGFGVSDLVVADRAQPRSGEAARWSDLLIVPSAGSSLRRRQSFAVLWESYDLAADAAGRNRYRVALALTVEEITRPSTLIWKIVGGVADAVGLSVKGDDRVQLSYTRERDASPALLDNLSVELDDAPAGRYLLTVTVTDLVRNQSASASRRVWVVE